MQIVLPLAVLVLTWLAVWRYFLAQGHSQVMGHVGGIVMGLMGATLTLFLATPRQKTEAWPPQEEKAVDATRSSETKEATEPQPPEEKKVIVGDDLVGGIPPGMEGALPESQPEEKEVEAGAAPAEETTAVPEPLSESTEGTMEQPSAEKDIPGTLGPEGGPVQKSPADQKAKAQETAPDQTVATSVSHPLPAVSKPPPPVRQATVKGPFTLRLTATAEQIWVRVSIDGGAQRTVPLKQGQSVTWTAKRRFVLSIDNTGGVRASLNGKALPRFGPAGQSRQNIAIPPAR